MKIKKHHHQQIPFLTLSWKDTAQLSVREIKLEACFSVERTTAWDVWLSRLKFPEKHKHMKYS